MHRNQENLVFVMLLIAMNIPFNTMHNLIAAAVAADRASKRYILMEMLTDLDGRKIHKPTD